ncbi:MAG: 30S ribosomal protein S3 [Caldiserica bacterium]|nr:MAG: 30S ribosomal protein S3 [Caldisericota bacterium]
MGQKIHPYGFRVGITKPWLSKWFAEKRAYVSYLIEDIKIRKMIRDKYKKCGVSKIEIIRIPGVIRIEIHTARPGVIIGKGGQDIEFLREDIERITNKKVNINVQPVKEPIKDAQIVAEMIAAQIEKKVPFRRVCKRFISRFEEPDVRDEVKGAKIMVSGRLDGAEIARSEWFRTGKLPLQTISADIDYGFCEARTKYGTIGVKVWLYKERKEEEGVISEEGQVQEAAEGKEEGSSPEGQQS